MFKKIKRLLGLNIIEWVDNTEKGTDHLEPDEYLLVESKEEGQMFFTKAELKRPKGRAPKQTENF